MIPEIHIDSPLLVSFKTYQGATFLRIYNLVNKSNGIPIDLAGYTAFMQLRKTASSPTSDLDINTTNGRIILEEIGVQSGTATSTASDIVVISGGIVDASLLGEFVQFSDLAGQFFKIVSIESATSFKIDTVITTTASTFDTIQKGQIKILVAASDMAALAPRVYKHYELDLITGVPDFVITYLAGDFTILAEHTR